MSTDNPRYFAGGDCVNGGGEVVDAVAHGKKAALGIHEALTKNKFHPGGTETRRRIGV
jgi:NADPH-dependent glutamate synthase beta subunit-like oxidoreductase